MTAPTREDLATFAAVLEEFAAAERARALTETRKQRIGVVRHVGDQNVTFEIVVDEGSSAADIFDILAPIDGAIDRLKAKTDMLEHYTRMADDLGLIEMTQKKMATTVAEFRRQNDARNENRRHPIVWTQTQAAAIDNFRDTIKDCFESIEGKRAAVERCRRILGGEPRVNVLDEQIEARLDQLRGARQDAA